MQIKEFKSYYFINKIKEHTEIKTKLLNLINQIPENCFDNISHTDWNLPVEMKRAYVDLFKKIVDKYLLKINNSLEAKNYTVNNIWFQRYKKNNYHNWHNHMASNYTNIYYLELPEINKKTEFLDIFTKKIIDVEVKEGDLLTFPAHVHHRSPVIDSDNTKTIISFNSCFNVC